MRVSAMLSPRVLGAAAVGTVLAACQPDANPAGPNEILTASPIGVTATQDLRGTEDLASPVWQGTAATLVAQAKLAPTVSARAYSLVGVAQYLAVQRGDAATDGRHGESDGDDDERGDDGRSQRDADRGAVAGASAVVLEYLFPLATQQLEDMVTAQGSTGHKRAQRAFARGEAIGRTVGAEIVTRAQGDGFDKPFTATIPSGPGFWISNTTPPTVAGGPLPGVRPWFLSSASQFRSAPPPAFGSPAFQAGLAEIRSISDTRTALQVQIATFWAQGAGTPTTPAFWLQVATDDINQHALSERSATHLYALLSATMFDAQIGCWDAKETYWFIRPWQADAAITVVATVGKPNHPSYPSGHSCISSSAAEVLSSFFPKDRAQLQAMVTEAGLSRMYGGIHYRFDIEAGQVLGRSVAQFAIAADRSGRSVLTPDDDEEGHGSRERHH
jgi:membrane-associated phospholipid phosphatase